MRGSDRCRGAISCEIPIVHSSTLAPDLSVVRPMFGVAAVKSLMTWTLKDGPGSPIVAGHSQRTIFTPFTIRPKRFVNWDLRPGNPFSINGFGLSFPVFVTSCSHVSPCRPASCCASTDCLLVGSRNQSLSIGTACVPPQLTAETIQSCQTRARICTGLRNTFRSCPCFRQCQKLCS
jgi:hypothetical protein